MGASKIPPGMGIGEHSQVFEDHGADVDLSADDPNCQVAQELGWSEAGQFTGVHKGLCLLGG